MLLEALFNLLERLALGLGKQEPTPQSREYRERSVYKSDLGSQSSASGLIVREIRVRKGDDPGEQPVCACCDGHDFPPVWPGRNFAATHPDTGPPRNVEGKEEQENHGDNAGGDIRSLFRDRTQSTHDHEKKVIEQCTVNEERTSPRLFDESLCDPNCGEPNCVENDADGECVGDSDLEEEYNAVTRDEINTARLLECLECK